MVAKEHETLTFTAYLGTSSRPCSDRPGVKIVAGGDRSRGRLHCCTHWTVPSLVEVAPPHTLWPIAAARLDPCQALAAAGVAPTGPVTGAFDWKLPGTRRGHSLGAPTQPRTVTVTLDVHWKTCQTPKETWKETPPPH